MTATEAASCATLPRALSKQEQIRLSLSGIYLQPAVILFSCRQIDRHTALCISALFMLVHYSLSSRTPVDPGFHTVKRDTLTLDKDVVT